MRSLGMELVGSGFQRSHSNPDPYLRFRLSCKNGNPEYILCGIFYYILSTYQNDLNQNWIHMLHLMKLRQSGCNLGCIIPKSLAHAYAAGLNEQGSLGRPRIYIHVNVTLFQRRWWFTCLDTFKVRSLKLTWKEMLNPLMCLLAIMNESQSVLTHIFTQDCVARWNCSCE